jgi:predicted dehydrogenase
MNSCIQAQQSDVRARTISVGVIGLGVGERHLEAYRDRADCRIVAACDASEQKRADVGSRYPDVRFCAEAADILDDPQIELVSIASYDSDHHAQVMHAIDRGKHIFVEKPLCLNREQAVEIRRALAARGDVMLSSNLVLRACPRFVDLKQRLTRGELGELYAVEGSYNYGRLEKLTQGWRGSLPDYSVVLGGAIHLVDLIRWLSGDEIEEVSAFGNGICTQGAGLQMNDMVLSAVRFSSGTVGKIAANFGCVMPHFHELKMYGTAGSFINDYRHARLFHARDPDTEPEFIETDYPGRQQRRILESFVEAIMTGTSPIVSSEDVFRCMSVCFAIEESVQAGRPVNVEYL